MKLHCKRVQLEYIPGEEIFTFPEDTGLPFIFDVLEAELTENQEAMDIVVLLCEGAPMTKEMITVLNPKRSDWNEIKIGLDNIGYVNEL